MDVMRGWRKRGGGREEEEEEEDDDEEEEEEEEEKKKKKKKKIRWLNMAAEQCLLILSYSCFKQCLSTSKFRLPIMITTHAGACHLS